MRVFFYFFTIFFFTITLYSKEININSLQNSFKKIDIDEQISSKDDKLYKLLKENSYDKYTLYKNGKPLHKQIRAQLEEAGIPLFFSYIPFWESEYNPKRRANSYVGLWQLSAQTAKNFGLHVSKKNDERLNPTLSTEAIIKILKHYHKKYKKWYLADFAYAMGESTLEKLIQRNKTDDFSVLIKDPKFPKGTKVHFATTILLQAQVGEDRGEKNTHEKTNTKKEPNLIKLFDNI